MRVWVVEKIQGRIIKQVDVEINSAEWDEESVAEALTEPCRLLDVSRPVVLQKHVNELNRYGRIIFRKAEFMESVNFDTLEFEIIKEKKSDKDLPFYSQL